MALVRLHKWMAEQGIAARRKCELFIKQGLVKVNGKIVTEMGVKIDPEKEIVTLDASLKIQRNQKHAYIALHKPKGYVTSVTGPEEPKVMSLLKNVKARVFPIGRLDKESSGLLLFTTDGRFAYEMTHPKFEKGKEYEVTLQSPISDKALRKLRGGVTIFKKSTARNRKGYRKKTKPAVIRRLAPNKFRIIIKEGMNRQIRRMCRKIGFRDIELKRVRIGDIELNDLPVGKYRFIRVSKQP